MMRNSSILLAMIVFLTQPAQGQSENHFVVSQYDNGTGMKVVYIYGYHAADCQGLIETIEASLIVDCPQCTRDFAGCVSNLGQYEQVWWNRQFIFPYVSWGNVRNVFFGAAREHLNWVCQALAAQHQSAGRDALCIL